MTHPRSCAAASTPSLSVSLTLAGLPSNVTLCRDAAAIATFGFDEQWNIGIDVDANAGTGDASGVDLVLSGATLPQSSGCSSSSVPLTDSVLVGRVFAWDPMAQTFIDTGVPLQPTLNFMAHTLNFAVDLTGALAGVSAQSKIVGASGASYTPSAMMPTLAVDNIGPATPGNTVMSASNNVQSCTTPCSTGSGYYPLIDIVGLSASLTLPPPPSLSVSLDLANLPSMITLCRDALAIAQYGADEQWSISIDVDGKGSTGDPNGFDVVLVGETLPQMSGCMSNSQAFTDSVLIGGVLVWDPVQQYFVDTGVPLQPTLDFMSNTMTFTADLTGPLADVSGLSKIYGHAAAGYTPTAQMPTAAFDNAGPTLAGTTIMSPSNDVQSCTAPCSAGASYYPLIDIVGLGSSTSAPLPAFGSNTLTVEFDLASLPANIDLCRYPALFTSPGGVDSYWLAGFDVDNNAATGLSGFDQLIFVYTTPQAQGCMTHTVPIGQALTAELDRFDDATQQVVFEANLPVNADPVTGKIVVQADRTATGLQGLNAHSPIGLNSAGLYSSGMTPYAQDGGPTTTLGASFTDPSGDVANCTSPCSPMVSWYGQIDLVGGSAHFENRIFRSGFEYGF